MSPESRHFAAYDGEDIVGVGYIVPVASPFDDKPKAWMLRGMAVESERQGQGVGAAVVRFVEDEAQREGIELLWFNARKIAVGFYARLGFESIGDEFIIPEIGPHFVMFKYLSKEN
ncbi:MAG: GNAT family N-acetyltransferase [Proteobacteria bacterium]|nr:MAG: GNAT family N-acetyltransferase [Pseudomonadota bacterium]